MTEPTKDSLPGAASIPTEGRRANEVTTQTKAADFIAYKNTACSRLQAVNRQGGQELWPI